jgi:hypothetical protein
MATTDARRSETPTELRRELEVEREELARAVESLRESADLTAAIRARLPLVLVAAFAAGFVLSGGIGATMRLLFRRGREGRTRAQLGPFAVVDRG